MVESLATAVAFLILGAASYTDIKTRRVPSYLWTVGFELGSLLLAYQLWIAVSGPIVNEAFLIRTGISVTLLVGLGLAFSPWGLHLFGGADAKAFILIGLLLPTFPTLTIGSTQLPLIQSQVGILSMSVIVNGMLLTLGYPLLLFLRNITVMDSVSRWSFLARSVDVMDVVQANGKLVTTPAGRSRNGLDLDTLRMYLRWRDTTLAEVRNDPDEYRLTPPTSPSQPTDGRVLDGSASYNDDPWAAKQFLQEHGRYGMEPRQLRNGLETLVQRDRVLVMPGIPLIVSLFIGLVSAIIIGDFLSVVIQLI